MIPFIQSELPQVEQVRLFVKWYISQYGYEHINAMHPSFVEFLTNHLDVSKTAIQNFNDLFGEYQEEPTQIQMMAWIKEILQDMYDVY